MDWTGDDNPVVVSLDGGASAGASMEISGDFEDPESTDVSTRVCNRCIVRKVKCDMRRPACSRCLEASVDCAYSYKRRKPGPAKGSRRKTTSTVSAPKNANYTLNSPPLPKGVSNTDTPTSSSENNTDTSEPRDQEHPIVQILLNTVSPWSSIPVTPSSGSGKAVGPPHFPPFTIPQEEELIHLFFNHIHPAIPLFREDKFLQHYYDGSISRDLLLTIFVFTAHILGWPSYWSKDNLDSSIKYIISIDAIEKETPTQKLSLDNFRLAALLVFFSFHQFPGEASWSRIGQLTRKAYQCGLHQIDNLDECSAFNRNAVNEEDLQEWRAVWWFLYVIDSYSNITAETPFMIENESIRTTLITGPRDQPEKQAKVSLPDDVADLWKTVQNIDTDDENFNFAMHIVSVTVLREVATIHRLQRLNSGSTRLERRRAALEDHITAVRLALPNRYLNYTREFLANESGNDYHARLVTAIHLHAARALNCVPMTLDGGEEEWRRRWHKALELVDEVVSIAKQWDGRFFSAVDPALCFIISGALRLVHLHSISEMCTELEYRARLENFRRVLLLFMKQFASTWTLAQLLIVSMEKFAESIHGPLNPEDILHIMKQFAGPIHATWLKFCPIHSGASAQIAKALDQSHISGEWDFNNWEAVVGDRKS